MKRLPPELILFVATVFWASSFVAQRLAADHVGAFVFNTCRYTVGGLIVYCVALFIAKTKEQREFPARDKAWYGYVLGVLLFLGAMCQQIGLATTTAGKAAFLTSGYVVIVPFLSTFIGHRIRTFEVLGGVFAFYGTYLLSVEGDFSLTSGDLWEIFGVLWWALHIIAISHMSANSDQLRICYQQLLTCAALSFIGSLFFEKWEVASLIQAAPAFIYAGIFSVAFSHVCQATTQHKVSPSLAAIIYSAEALMAAGFGWMLLGETFSDRMIFGAALMVVGVMMAQCTSKNPPPLVMEG